MKHKRDMLEANNLLEHIAVTDQLTGAYNRRFIMKRMDQELALSVRHSLPLSVIMIDIDHFKNVNDTYGHHTGDEVLRGLVNVLSANIRVGDLLGRYGGEEFIVISPFTELDEALLLADRLRYKVSEWLFETSSGVVRVTISLGVAAFDVNAAPDQEIQSDFIIDQADAQMYRAKAMGRNRVSPESPKERFTVS